jgi:hypothetical protein
MKTWVGFPVAALVLVLLVVLAFAWRSKSLRDEIEDLKARVERLESRVLR